jgi:hypothetical protein
MERSPWSAIERMVCQDLSRASTASVPIRLVLSPPLLPSYDGARSPDVVARSIRASLAKPPTSAKFAKNDILVHVPALSNCKWFFFCPSSSTTTTSSSSSSFS